MAQNLDPLRTSLEQKPQWLAFAAHLLLNKGCTLSIVRDEEISSSKVVLEDKAKQLRLAGRGKRPNKARQVSEEEEEIFCRS